MDVNTWREKSGQSEGGCLILNASYTEGAGSTLSEANVSLGKGKRYILTERINPEGVLSTVQCTAWEYDTSKFRRTVSSEFDLVCEREFLLSVGQTVFFLGMLCAGPISGVLSDRFGRKPVLIAMIMLLSISGKEFTSIKIMKNH